MFKKTLMGIAKNGILNIVFPRKDKNDSGECHIINSEQHLITHPTEELSYIGIFDEANGLSDLSDDHYKFKKCMASLALDIPVHEKIEMLVWSSAFIGELSDADYNSQSAWCKGAYKTICKHLRNGISKESNAVEIANIFRWGSDLIKIDIHLARHLLEAHYPLHDVIADPSKFPRNVVYAHANMLSHSYFDMSLSDIDRSYYARLSIGLLNHLLGFDAALKNRANYLLSMVHKVLGDFEKSLHHFITALNGGHSLPFQKKLIIRLLFDLLPEEKLPPKLEKVLIDGNRILNSLFWSYLSDNIHSTKIKGAMKAYTVALTAKECVGDKAYELSNAEINDINAYIDAVYSAHYFCDETKSRKLLSVASAKDTPALAKHIIFRNLAYSFIHKNKYIAMYYASMSLYHKYESDMAVFIQRMLLDVDYNTVCKALTVYRNGHRDLAIIDAAESFKNAVWIDGEPIRETAVLDYMIKNSFTQEAIDLAKVRAAFIYIKGECTLNRTLGIQNFKKGDDYLDSISFNGAEEIMNGIRDYGFYRHQKSLIQSSDDGEFVFIEKEGSDKLIIVFSCRYTYNVFQSGPRFVDGLETNALFINNPEGNWYSDKEEERVSRLIEKYALSKFKRSNILCHNASMGGYAAMKFAIKHKLLCLAANPQFNLHFWSFARPTDAERILLCKNIVNLDKVSIDEINGLKACIIIGRHPHDVLPFQSWFDNAIKAKDYTYIIIKHDIPEHDALLYRAYGDSFMREIFKEFGVLQETELLSRDFKERDFNDIVHLQKEINDSYAGRWVIHNRNGKYFIA